MNIARDALGIGLRRPHVDALLSEHAPIGFHQRDALMEAKRLSAGYYEINRGIDRQHRPAKGEAIVAELSHLFAPCG